MNKFVTILAMAFAVAFSPIGFSQVSYGNSSTSANVQNPEAVLPPTFVKGEMTAQYGTRTNTNDDGSPKEGAIDKFSLKINVSNSTEFRGTIDYQPFIKNTLSSNQPAQLTYNIDADVLNPRNIEQKRNIGKLFGTAPINPVNVYSFTEGTAKMAVFSAGQAKGFDSAFKGTVIGKPPTAKSTGLFAKIKKEAMSIKKVVKGQTISIPVIDYDKMEFQNHVLPAGPVGIYSEVTVNGTMIYDYGRAAWYFDNVTVTYTVGNRQYVDKISGNIRWVESPSRATSGEGQYEFDIRVNEPAQGEASLFAGPADESSFFAMDDAVPALTGTMKYKDTIINDTVTKSLITIDLKGNKLAKEQTMYLTKLLFFTVIVPLNAE